MNTEITTAVTDLLISVICLIYGIMLLRKKTGMKRHQILWCRMFFTTAFASLLGYINHNFIWSSMVEGLIWLFLYPSLFDATRIIVSLSMDARFGEKYIKLRQRKLFLLAEILLCIPAIIFRFFISTKSMIFYVLFAAVALIFCFIHFGVMFLRGSSESKLLLGTLLVSLPAVILQFTKKGFIHIIWDFDHNGISHLLIIVSLSIAYLGALKSLHSEEYSLV